MQVRTLLTTLSIIASGLLFYSCDRKEVEEVEVANVAVSQSSLTLEIGESANLTATVSPSNATNKVVTWISTNQQVATVNNGTVTAVSPGTTQIIAAAGGKSGSCSVTVEKPPVAVASVSLDKSEVTLKKGETTTLKVTVSPSDANNKNVKWVSSDAEVAMVDNNGKVSAIAPGSAVIFVITDDGGLAASCTVTVNPTSVPVESVSLSDTGVRIIEGNNTTLKVSVNPKNATEKEVLFSSSDESVATVNAKGVVSGVKEGTATITVTSKDGGKTAKCDVIVIKKPMPVSGVKISLGTLKIEVGDKATLSAIVSPTDATNKNVTWTSSNESVLTIDQNGEVTGIKAGSSTVTVTTEDGGKTATCKVTVKDRTPVTEVSLNKITLALTVGGTARLTATVLPKEATQDVTWSSSNPEVATVDDSGNVTGVKAGTATVTVTTKSGNMTALCDVTVTKSTVAVKDVALNKALTTISIGDSETLIATITPSDATNTDVTWSTSSGSVATVDANGKVTGIKAGKATITVQTVDGGKFASCRVTVTKAKVPVSGVSLNEHVLNLFVGSTETLKATVKPSDATNTGVTWSSSDPYVASVSANGLVTARNAGSALIYVTTVDGGKADACQVNVTEAPQTSLSFKSQTIVNGMAGFKTYTFVFRSMVPVDRSRIDSQSEAWRAEGEEYSMTLPAMLQYNVSPSSVDFDDSYNYSFITQGDLSMTPRIYSCHNGTLNVIADLKDSGHSGDHTTKFALQVSKNGNTVTSDYASARVLRKTAKLSGFRTDLRSNLDQVWTNAIDQSSCGVTLDHTSTLDLKTAVMVKMADADNPSNTSDMTAAEIESAGLDIEYEVVKNYICGNPLERQENFVRLSGGILSPTYSGTMPSGGRTPIIRIKLLNNGDIVDVAYLKVYIKFPD